MKKTLLLLFCLALTLSACGQPAMTAGEEVSPAVDVTTPSVPGAFEEPLPSFPPAGEMLEVDCGEYAPLKPPGNHMVRLCRWDGGHGYLRPLQHAGRERRSHADYQSRVGHRR